MAYWKDDLWNSTWASWQQWWDTRDHNASDAVQRRRDCHAIERIIGRYIDGPLSADDVQQWIIDWSHEWYTRDSSGWQWTRSHREGKEDYEKFGDGVGEPRKLPGWVMAIGEKHLREAEKEIRREAENRKRRNEEEKRHEREHERKMTPRRRKVGDTIVSIITGCAEGEEYLLLGKIALLLFAQEPDEREKILDLYKAWRDCENEPFAPGPDQIMAEIRRVERSGDPQIVEVETPKSPVIMHGPRRGIESGVVAMSRRMNQWIRDQEQASAIAKALHPEPEWGHGHDPSW
ncbi:hypothetical protein [Kitasatospora cinereorecta]|uniref:Uncharacterized protein n=1 Tax=Kitasatospora cinereorecta TaxID=285560 RepID=A0ABW0VHK1_9ACTN